jgi:rsbT co-antagonist protein RsbR
MSNGSQGSKSVGIAGVLSENEDSILEGWVKEMSAATRRSDLMKDSDVRVQCALFLKMLQKGAESGTSDLGSAPWEGIRTLLTDVSRTRAQKGFSPTETATFVMSVKKPLFELLRKRYGSEMYVKTREEIIRRQQEEMLELSTPVVKLWDGILALPIIGTLDSARTQVVMESLLESIVKTSSRVAIIDITGVPTVDTLVAQHLLKTVTAARLMGADCIISGVRPQIAQTIVHLGINLLDVTTKATLSDAFVVALQRTGMSMEHSIKTE